MEKDLLPIGRVAKPHGVRGKIKVDYFGEDLSLFSHYREIFIKTSGPSAGLRSLRGDSPTTPSHPPIKRD